MVRLSGPYFLSVSVTIVLTTIELSERPSGLLSWAENHRFCPTISSRNDSRDSGQGQPISNNLKNITWSLPPGEQAPNPGSWKIGLLPPAPSEASGQAAASTLRRQLASAQSAALASCGQNRPAIAPPYVSLPFTGVLIPERRLECKKKIKGDYHAYRLRLAPEGWGRFPADASSPSVLLACL